MGNLTKNISRWEIECHCKCGKDTIDHQVVKWVQEAADHFANKYTKKVIVDISSGFRCEEKNKIEGGSEKSQHLVGRAIDHSMRFNDGNVVPLEELYEYYDKKLKKKGGLAIYTLSKFIHIDSRNIKTRWVGD